MIRSMLPALAALLLLPLRAPAQEDLTDLFDRGSFYESAGVLRGKGDVPFYADVSFLRGRADSTQAMLGIALSNSAFQFVKQREGYRAAYEVELRIEGDRGSFRNNWEQEVRVPSFDETLVESETVVFQSSFGLVPGEYRMKLRVRDMQGDQDSEAQTTLQVPAIAPAGSGYALSQPVLLRFFDEAAADGERRQVLYPSHYFASVPRELSFFVEVYAGEGAAPPAGLVVSVVPDGGGPAVTSETLDVPPLEEGRARVYASVPGRGMDSGLFRLELALQDSAGATLAGSSTKVSVSAVSQWVRENWEAAVELLAYEASDDERERLEETPAGRRLEAWTEFWRVRDPVPATPGNEAFESYFRRITVANANFGTQLRPGWKSDRGRVYVAFGPPSDVIKRPVNSGSFPLEVWVYDTPGFEIVFEDRIGFGNYQIANPGTFANELAALDRRKQRAIAERREAERQGEEGGGDEVAPASTAPAGQPARVAPPTTPAESPAAAPADSASG